jgi:hypothetical protein
LIDLGPLGLYGEIDDARPRARDSCTSYATENTDYLTPIELYPFFILFNCIILYTILRMQPLGYGAITIKSYIIYPIKKPISIIAVIGC